MWGLGLYSLLAATLLPGGSELGLYALIRHEPGLAAAALAMSTIGNTLGGMISWGCGRLLPDWKKPGKPGMLMQLQRWGSPLLLFAWLPLIGDALCVGAGWLRLRWLPCCVFMLLGKFIRYYLVVQTALPN